MMSTDWKQNGLGFDFDYDHFVKRANERSIDMADLVELLTRAINNQTIVKRLKNMDNGEKAFLRNKNSGAVGAFSKKKFTDRAGHKFNSLYFHTTGGKVDPDNPNTQTFKRGWTANDSGPQLTVEQNKKPS